MFPGLHPANGGNLRTNDEGGGGGGTVRWEEEEEEGEEEEEKEQRKLRWDLKMKTYLAFTKIENTY